MSRITVTLNEQEIKALLALAKREVRDPRAQATLIIRKELERQKLIESNEPSCTSNEINASAQDQAGKVVCAPKVTLTQKHAAQQHRKKQSTHR